MSLKILITGGDGQLAKSVLKVNNKHQITALSKSNLDVLDANAVSVIQEAKPDYIFHFASLTRREECAKKKEMAFDINVRGTENVVRAIHGLNTKLVFISTNEVFDGTKKNFYTEIDTPNPLTTVGKTKYEAEKIIQKYLQKYYIIRTSWLYGEWSKNFLNMVVSKSLNNKKLSLVADEISSPTLSLDLARNILSLIAHNSFGTYHIANGGQASRYEFGMKILQFLKLNSTLVTKTKLSAFDFLEYPPKYTPLRSEKIQNLNIEPRDWETALQEFLKNVDHARLLQK